MLSAPRRIQYESLAGRLSTFNDFLGSPELEGASRAHVKKHSRLCYLSTILLEQINKNESLLKKYKNWDHHHGQSLSNCANQKGKSSFRSEDDLWLERHSHASQSNEICNSMDAKVRNLNTVSSKS
ncbi:chaperone DnaJ-domain superfamily protein [Striga asiatica]|uniref:Chaperone DnaJ-domain superfamily protein n=1 Tax=Striga asiatica TaxID=4170 RepID=A0A5A7PRL0_STRAF|nr:chaperone DnaJ-domain superfamily protein [Striga asiatica]